MRMFVLFPLFFAAVANLHAANIVQNPGFETGLTSWTVAGAGSGGFNWTASSAAHSGSGAARDGCTGGTCITNPDSILYQDLATTIGQSYVLAFWAGSGSGAGPSQLQALLGGTLLFDLVNFPNPYTLYTSAVFTATSSVTRVEFYGRNDPSFVQLDDVCVDLNGGACGFVDAPIPEPSPALLMGLGGLLIFSYYRRVRFRHGR